MKGNFHVRFLGEGAAAMPLPYPTNWTDRRGRIGRLPANRVLCGKRLRGTFAYKWAILLELKFYPK